MAAKPVTQRVQIGMQKPQPLPGKKTGWLARVIQGIRRRKQEKTAAKIAQWKTDALKKPTEQAKALAETAEKAKEADVAEKAQIAEAAAQKAQALKERQKLVARAKKAAGFAFFAKACAQKGIRPGGAFARGYMWLTEKNPDVLLEEAAQREAAEKSGQRFSPTLFYAKVIAEQYIPKLKQKQ